MNGWIFIDKPQGITSFKVIQRLIKVLKIKKIGHSGTLDPFATGILAVAVGEATKSINYFNQNKVYTFNIVFGEGKDTDDITGKTIKKSNVIPTEEKIRKHINFFIGLQKQVPPKYSAVKVNGQRAYKLARNDKKFEIKQRKIFIKTIKMNVVIVWILGKTTYFICRYTMIVIIIILYSKPIMTIQI